MSLFVDREVSCRVNNGKKGVGCISRLGKETLLVGNSKLELASSFNFAYCDCAVVSLFRGEDRRDLTYLVEFISTLSKGGFTRP